MSKKTYFYIDDVIWLFRDLTRQAPKSIFDNAFMKMLKNAHDKYGLKVQLNVFYRTDFYYGNDEFTLADMTDAYKAEWEANSDWIRFGFHSKQEFPDYPYVNAKYEDVKENFYDTKNEILRFASEKNWGRAVVPHWRPISKEGIRALVDCGIKVTSATIGEKGEYNGDPNSLPYGHAGRLLQNRTPDTGTFTRNTKDLSILNSICSYNHLTDEQIGDTLTTHKFYKDEETGIRFKNFLSGPLHNASKKEDLREEMQSYIGNDYIGWASHEQYFYPDYYAYQPDYEEKIIIGCEVLKENGYEFIFIEDLIED